MTYESGTTRLDRAATALANRQHGIVRFGQLVDLGLKAPAIAVRVEAGRLHRVHKGVYSVVAPRLLRIEGRWLAAVLACGPGAALSHTDAAALWEIRGIGSGPIHVTVPTNAGRRKRREIIVHRSLSLPGHTTTRRGIAVTSLARTLQDLRRTDRGAYTSALRRAAIRRLDTGFQADTPPDPERSRLERRFHALCRRHSLPLPRAQQIIGPYTVDFLWPAERLIVEVDGWETHGTPIAFEDDRARDTWLTAQGYRVIRFTWRQVTREGPWVARSLRQLLGASPASGSARARPGVR